MATPKKRRVVVTGLGCLTPIGNDLGSAWKNLLDARSGAAEITRFDHSRFAVHFAHEVKGFDPADHMDVKETKHTDRFVHMAAAAAKMAMASAGLSPGSFDPNRAGVVQAAGLGGIRSLEEQHDRYLAKGPKRLSAFTIPMFMPNDAPGQLAIELGLKGPNYCTVSACASSAHGVGLAMRHVQWGEADIMLAGGSEAAISPLILGAFVSMGALSTRNDDPTTASRPFDRDRDGFVMGEGAGVLVLEELDHALSRGAEIFAEALGYGFTDDAHHITAPDPGGEGMVRSMEIAIRDSGLRPEDINYINAHGTSTLLNDRTESAAIRRVFGDHTANMAVSSTKGQTGHLLGAGGAVEALFTAMAIRHSLVPPTINHVTPDPECGLDCTPNAPRRREIRYALSNSLAFGGHNATLCFGKYEG